MRCLNPNQPLNQNADSILSHLSRRLATRYIHDLKPTQNFFLLQCRLFCSPLPFQSDDEIDDETDVTGGPFISLWRVPLMYKRGICLIEKQRGGRAYGRRIGPLTCVECLESGPVMSKLCGISLTFAELINSINLLRAFDFWGMTARQKHSSTESL